jgi:hypothetical protein
VALVWLVLDIQVYRIINENFFIMNFDPSPIEVNFAPEIIQTPLRFVQRGRILLRCGSALRYRCPPWAFPP